MMKAMGYTMKGDDDDQGVVIGNRYGISREIRPKYDTLDLFGGLRRALTVDLKREKRPKRHRVLRVTGQLVGGKRKARNKPDQLDRPLCPKSCA
jgi:hypothetical protein